MRGTKTEVGSRRFWRNKALAFYKKKRKKDRELGREINRIVQALHVLRKERAVEQGKVDPQIIKDSLDKLVSLRQEERFRDHFPTFPSFKNFLKEYNFTLSELEEEENE